MLKDNEQKLKYVSKYYYYIILKIQRFVDKAYIDVSTNIRYAQI